MSMEYKGDIGLYLSGQDVKIPACGIFVRQPKIKDILMNFGETMFFSTVQMLADPSSFASIMKEGNSVLADVPDFQIMIGVLGQENNPLSQNFNKFFGLCFPDFDVSYSSHSIDFKVDDNVVGIVNTFNIEEFGQTLRELFIPAPQDEEPEYNIDESNVTSRRLLEKIKRNREKLAKARAHKEGENMSIIALYTSVLSIGLSMDINVLYNYTVFQLFDAFKRYIAKMQFDQYRELMMIPFADTASLKDKEPDNWIANLYKPSEEKYNSLSQLNNIGSEA